MTGFRKLDPFDLGDVQELLHDAVLSAVVATVGDERHDVDLVKIRYDVEGLQRALDVELAGSVPTI